MAVRAIRQGAVTLVARRFRAAKSDGAQTARSAHAPETYALPLAVADVVFAVPFLSRPLTAPVQVGVVPNLAGGVDAREAAAASAPPRPAFAASPVVGVV